MHKVSPGMQFCIAPGLPEKVFKEVVLSFQLLSQQKNIETVPSRCVGLLERIKRFCLTPLALG